MALDLVEARKQQYKENAIAYYRPWVFLVTDGTPTDSWESAAGRVHEGAARGAFAFFAVGVEGADFGVLRRVAGKREPIKLQGLSFGKMFQWLSASLSNVSRSQPGDAVPLANPTGPQGWAEV